MMAMRARIRLNRNVTNPAWRTASVFLDTLHVEDFPDDGDAPTKERSEYRQRYRGPDGTSQ